MEPTNEMRLAFAEAPGADKNCVCAICLNHRLAAVLAIHERELRKQIADELDEHAIHLRNGAFRTGAIGIEYLHGVEGAAYLVRTGDLP